MTTIDEIDLNIEYLDFDKADYGFEYGVVLTIEDGEILLSVEKALTSDGNYKMFDFDYVFASKECSDKLIINQSMYEGEMDVFVIDSDCE